MADMPAYFFASQQCRIAGFGGRFLRPYVHIEHNVQGEIKMG